MRFFFLPLLIALPALAQWPSIDAPLPRQGGGEKDAALIISIADYAFLPDISGAKENAAAWYQYLTSTRGVPATQVTWLQDTDATLEGVQDALAELPKKVKGGGTVWILYIGHGAPSQDSSDGVLVGADAQNVVRSLYARSLPRAKLLDALANGPHARAVVLLDTCFSGQNGSGQQLATGTMPTLPERDSPVKTKKPLVLLTAGTSRQFAGALPGLERPAFSYLALGGLRGWADDDGDGAVTASELVTFANAVMGTTLRGRQQTPQLNPPTAKDTVLGKAAKNERLELNQVVLALFAGTTARPPSAPGAQPEVTRRDANVATAASPKTVKSESGQRTDQGAPTTEGVRTEAPSQASREQLEQERLEDLGREEKITSLKRIIPKIEDGNPQKADLLFQLADLYWERSRYLYHREMVAFLDRRREADEKNARGEKVIEPSEDHRESELYRTEMFRLYSILRSEYRTYERSDEVLFNLAYNLYDTGQRDEAVKTYEELIKSYPGSRFVADCYVQLGNHFFDVDKAPDKARRHFERAFASLNPRIKLYALYKLAWCDFREGEHEKALKKLLDVIALSEKAGKEKLFADLKNEALRDSVRMFVQLGRADDAIAYYKAIPGKKRLSLLTSLGAALKTADLPSSALKAYRSILEDPLAGSLDSAARGAVESAIRDCESASSR